MSIAKKQSSKTKCPEVTSSLKLSTTFNHSTQPVYLPALTSFKRQRCPSPSPSSSFNLSTKPELNSETDEPLTVTSPQAEDLFSTRQIKPLHRSRPRVQKLTTSSTLSEQDHRNSNHLARTAAHDVRTGACTVPRSETRTTTSLSANTPMTSAEWCQAKQDDPAAVSLALATRDLIGMSMSVDMQEEGFGQNTREEEEEKKEKKKEEERPKKKKKKSTKKGWDEEKHSRRVFEWIPSPGPGGLEPVPEEFVKGTVS
ncbi:hypothetical protein GE21DRAFT_9194 [Neurospora crassa]|uniref:Uncharacterized protein n=1 Tax=Neurospora crassa (strain ATCC 24698 / 74-OR23-1A / CBS 708.71 / DSM 1257 / FGSC 987) TaxID=367110 RepID=Q7RXJ9_NEUCR|nr:hypothetical protein NCU03983 [Neurospora crassa OR74A]EAA27332.1 hypothetical protein NCU03983 [Neurospora crassa OR74A]KHE86276.1 hypothetical protein GE21DRAFT_9194 [Neurospora crassa]|eukprot:XP_956568.1 hypothetical protein NCU03983 [Neurospora crassa OR74A]